MPLMKVDAATGGAIAMGMGGCLPITGCVLAIIVFNLTIGGLLFQYTLWSILGRDIPWYGDAVAGLFLGEFALPAAVICWILRLCGVEVPFVR